MWRSGTEIGQDITTVTVDRLPSLSAGPAVGEGSPCARSLPTSGWGITQHRGAGASPERPLAYWDGPPARPPFGAPRPPSPGRPPARTTGHPYRGTQVPVPASYPGG
jgi:hypothetical protein